MSKRRWSRPLTGILLVVASGGCSPTSSPNITPAAAFLYIDAEPMAAAVDAMLELDDAEGGSVDSLRFGFGIRIIAQLARMPGQYTLRSLAPACEIALALEGGVEADVRMTLDDDGTCSFAERVRHDPTQPGHIFGAVSVTVGGLPTTGDAFVAVRSVDEPPNPVPDTVAPEPDRPGQFQVFGLAPGGYQVSVIRGGLALASGSVVIAGDGREERLTLQVSDAG